MVLMFLLTWSTDSVLGPDTEHKWNAVKYDKLIVILLAGWYSGLCQSLQRHLRLLGIRLPAGPHLSDTSLLLGCYQSQLPREQLRLEWVLVRPGPARPSPARLEEQTTLLVFFMLFRFQTGHVQRSGTYGRECVWEVYCTCEEVYVGGASCCVRLICFRLAEQSWRVSISPPTRPQGLKSCPGVCQNTESRTWEKLWFFFFLFLFSWWMPKLADLKMVVEQTGWIWSFWSSVCVVFSADTHLISFVTEQTKMRQPPTNSSPVALRLYAIVRVVLLLVWLQLQKAAHPYCIVTFTLPVYTDIVLLYDFNSRKMIVFFFLR